MVVLYPAVLAVVIVLLAERRGRSGSRGWRWFAAWTAAGGLFTFSYLAGFSIGLFVLPLAAAALFFVANRAPRFAESLGFLAGVGAVALGVGLSNLGYTPCGDHAELSVPPGAPAGTSVSCGGTDPIPWLAAGFALTALAVAGRALADRR